MNKRLFIKLGFAAVGAMATLGILKPNSTDDDSVFYVETYDELNNLLSAEFTQHNATSRYIGNLKVKVPNLIKDFDGEVANRNKLLTDMESYFAYLMTNDPVEHAAHPTIQPLLEFSIKYAENTLNIIYLQRGL